MSGGCQGCASSQVTLRHNLELLISDDPLDQIPDRKDPVQFAIFEHRQMATLF
jgi:Fe-S cluster biogenesis protein NfuA